VRKEMQHFHKWYCCRQAGWIK